MNCPDCGAETDSEKNHLTEEEWTYIISCPECTFEIETESNLAGEDKR